MRLRHLLLALLLPPLLGQAPLGLPARLDDGWAVGDAAEAGFDAPGLQALLAQVRDGGLNLHGLLVERHGRLVAELYRRGRDRSVFSLFPRTRAFGPRDLHDTRSVGKSVIGLLVGLEVQAGRIPGVEAPVAPLLGCPRPAAEGVTVAQLLGMSSGLRWQEGGPGRDDEHRLMWAWDPVRYALDRPRATAPGTAFTYDSGGTAALAALVARCEGRPWTEVARTAIFEPLGIRGAVWITDLFGRPMAYTGLRMRPRDMAKLGRLVLNRGRWGDRQLVPSAWIDACLTPRLATGFEDTRYGYQWWTGTVAWRGRALPWAAAFGNGGQRIYVVPELDLCVVTTAGAYGDLASARRIQALFRALVATVRG
ncbi:MAG TPA: serine hydrolase [Holophagaceae bacterium]|nr:serine hydrolase [Holophagaceae bacterium]